MDDVSKDAVLRKSSVMKKIVAYPKELLSDALIDEYAQNLSFDEPNFLKNALNLNRFHYDNALADLRKHSEERSWTKLSDSTSVRAYYQTFSNAFSKLFQKYYAYKIKNFQDQEL